MVSRKATYYHIKHNIFIDVFVSENTYYNGSAIERITKASVAHVHFDVSKREFHVGLGYQLLTPWDQGNSNVANLFYYYF